MSVGTAVNIGHSSNEAKGTFFLSCGHGVETTDRHSITISGLQYPVRLLKKTYSGPIDLALFFLDNREMQPVHNVATSSPGINEKAWMVGYPGSRNGNFRETRGNIEATRVVGYEYQFNRRALSGESGGPLFVKGFKVVGIISASRPGETLVTTVSEIRAFLTKAVGNVPNCAKPKVETEPYPNPPDEESPTPIVKPITFDTSKLEAAIRTLVLQNVGLKLQIAALNKRIDNLKPGTNGEDGVDGKDGANGVDGNDGSPGLVTVILVEDGVESKRVSNVRSGSTVRLNVKRFKKETE